MRILTFSIILFFLFTSCKGAHFQNRQTKILKFTFTTWDGEYSMVIGDDSLNVGREIRTSYDSIYTVKYVISHSALNFIGDFVYTNSKDSVKASSLDGQKYALINRIYTSQDSLIFYIQKTSSNDYLESFIDIIKKSPYKNECNAIIDRLEIYNKLDKYGH